MQICGKEEKTCSNHRGHGEHGDRRENAKWKELGASTGLLSCGAIEGESVPSPYYYLLESCFRAKISGSTERKILKSKELCLAQRRQERKGKSTAVLSSWRSLRLGESWFWLRPKAAAGSSVISVVNENNQNVPLSPEMALQELRQAMNLTQQELADLLRMNQAAVSKLEHQSDMYVSTLRRFVAPWAGNYALSRTFPQGDVVVTQFEDIRKRGASRHHRVVCRMGFSPCGF